MMSITSRRSLAGLVAVGALLVPACDGDAADVPGDPQGPAEDAPGTEVRPDVSPTE